MINTYRLTHPASNIEMMDEIAVFGEAQVGKTCFIDMLTRGYHFAPYMGVGVEDSRHRMTVDGAVIEADFIDLSSTTLRTADSSFSPELFMCSLTGAIGVVLIYDITSSESFEHITEQGYAYACLCNNYMGEKAGDRICEYILVGNKKDIVQKEPERRQVDSELAEQWAQSQGMQHFELSTHTKEEVNEAAHVLMRSIIRAKERAKRERCEVRGPRSREHDNTTTRIKIKQAFGKLKRNT